MTRCTVCQLPPERLAAIDEGLRAQIPLAQLAASCGLSKSTLSRHSQHLDGRTTDPTDTNPDAAAQVIAPQITPTRSVATQQSASVAPPQASVGPSKEVLLSRIELLWSESLDGLEAAKEPVRVKRPDGAELEIPGDLRARAGFIREGRQIVELAGAVTGNLVRGDTGGAHVAIQIVCPAQGSSTSADLDDEGVTIDIGPGSGGR
jgi:hypothetical protein